jgi:S1-C subfamily serine protease
VRRRSGTIVAVRLRSAALLLVASGLVAATSVSAAPAGAAALERATVGVGAGCTGVLVERSQLVATALHCLGEGVRSVGVRLADGSRHTAWVVGTDPHADQAVLFIPEDVALAPLAIASGRPPIGSAVTFGGRPDRFRAREARIERIGTCPSLPALPDALFTTIDGVPGDSGAPLVDQAGRVVGLVHGGARCEIATPASTLGALVRDVLRPGT